MKDKVHFLNFHWWVISQYNFIHISLHISKLNFNSCTSLLDRDFIIEATLTAHALLRRACTKPKHSTSTYFSCIHLNFTVHKDHSLRSRWFCELMSSMSKFLFSHKSPWHYRPEQYVGLSRTQKNPLDKFQIIKTNYFQGLTTAKRKNAMWEITKNILSTHLR